MPPSGSLSPRRRRARKPLSLSSASGAKWVAGLSSLGAPSAPQRRRRGSSPAITTLFTNSQLNDSPCSEEDDYPRLLSDDEVGIPHAETFPTISLPQRQPLTYASLPPTPISRSPPRHASPPPQPISPPSPPPSPKHQDTAYEPPFSIWDYLREELLATDFDSHQELKWERVTNFLSMPFAMEKVTVYLHRRHVPIDFESRYYSSVSSYASTPSSTHSRSSLFASSSPLFVCCSVQSFVSRPHFHHPRKLTSYGPCSWSFLL